MVRRRRRAPVAVLAALLAVAISSWIARDDAPATAPVERPVERRAEPRVEPPPAATQQQASGLEQSVPDATERAELAKVLDLIERGGPFPHKQDGAVFGNREGRLPQQPRGYYHEYTVRTPGERTRGARRVVRGDGGELYYTRDHYRTFMRVDNE